MKKQKYQARTIFVTLLYDLFLHFHLIISYILKNSSQNAKNAHTPVSYTTHTAMLLGRTQEPSFPPTYNNPHLLRKYIIEYSYMSQFIYQKNVHTLIILTLRKAFTQDFHTRQDFDLVISSSNFYDQNKKETMPIKHLHFTKKISINHYMRSAYPVHGGAVLFSKHLPPPLNLYILLLKEIY